MPRSASCFSRHRAADFISKIDKQSAKRYLHYWRTITPRNHREYYLRWIFAFMSIHTTWKRNVESFIAIRDLVEPFTWQQLLAAIEGAKPGLTKMRTRAVWEFHNRFWANPGFWYPRPDESMADCRDRLAKATYGIGLAKTSFVLEMAFPAKCDVVCLDTHILQLYNYKKASTPGPKDYRRMEAHWIAACDKQEVPSPIVRHIYWDKVQEQPDTRYWSHCLEKAA